MYTCFSSNEDTKGCKGHVQHRNMQRLYVTLKYACTTWQQQQQHSEAAEQQTVLPV